MSARDGNRFISSSSLIYIIRVSNGAVRISYFRSSTNSFHDKSPKSDTDRAEICCRLFGQKRCGYVRENRRFSIWIKKSTIQKSMAVTHGTNGAISFIKTGHGNIDL